MKRAAFSLLIFFFALLGAGMFSMCRNPTSVRQGIKASKPYWDDIIKWSSRVIVGRYSKTYIRQVANVLIKRVKVPVYDYNGKALYFVNGRTSVLVNGKPYLMEEQWVRQKATPIVDKVIHNTLTEINKHKVYPNEIDDIIMKVIYGNPKFSKSSVNYYPSTQELYIDLEYAVSRVNIERIILEGLVLDKSGHYLIRELK